MELKEKRGIVISQKSEMEPYKLLIEAKTKSKATIIGLPTESFLRQKKYGASFTVTNIGSVPFPRAHQNTMLQNFYTKIKVTNPNS